MLLLCSSESGSKVADRVEANRRYEGYLIQLGGTARKLGRHGVDDIRRGTIDFSNTSSEMENSGRERKNSMSENLPDRMGREPKGRTPTPRNVPVYNTPVRFIEPLSDLTLAPGSTLEVTCEAVGASWVHVTFTPRDLDNVWIVSLSDTRVSVTFNEVRQKIRILTS